MEPASVRLELDLTPGIALAEAIIADIDRDGDGTLSPDEQRAYASQVVSALPLEVDGTPIRAQLVLGLVWVWRARASRAAAR